MLGIIDTGIANLNSMKNICAKAGWKAIVLQSPEKLADCSRVILPGIGSWDAGVKSLHKSGMFDAILSYAKLGRPMLGVCLGMQLLLDESEEGTLPGLGLVSGKCVKFNKEIVTHVTHMGWNTVRVLKKETFFPQGDEQRFYFVHSYKCVVSKEDSVFETTYGEPFTSGFQRNHIAGVQFHPEKSHKFGLEILIRFLSWET
jgi:imidazole glycerol-phosphate synthase subunit HisH